jgi:hypothetical protein
MGKVKKEKKGGKRVKKYEKRIVRKLGEVQRSV